MSSTAPYSPSPWASASRSDRFTNFDPETFTLSDTDARGTLTAVDPVVFRQLFREHAPFVWRVLRRFGVAQADLDDVCQEVFVVVHRRLPEFQGRSSLRTWLYEIARRAALAQRRKRRTAATLDEQVEAHDPGPLPPEQLEQRRALHWLSQALTQLDADKREAFVLYELEEMTLAEVSEALGAPLNTIHYRIQAARSILRERAEREQAPDRQRLVSGRTR